MGKFKRFLMKLFKVHSPHEEFDKSLKVDRHEETFTNCDKCDHLQICIEECRVINCRTTEDDFEHYIAGLGAVCIVDENKIIELFGKPLEEMTEDEISENLKKLQEMVSKN